MPDSPSNFFVRHWRGDVPLKTSFWLNFALCSVLLLVAARLIADRIDFYASPENAVASIIGLWVVISSVTVWQIVGVFRSSLKYSTAHPSKQWGYLAIVVIFLRVLQFGFLFAVEAVPQLHELWQLVGDEDPVGKFQFRVLRDSTELELSGDFSFRVSREAEKYLDTYPTIKMIHLNSQGGRIREARALARLITEHKLSTYTASGCSGACVIPFAAGEQRLMRPGAHMAFYQYDLPGMPVDEVESEYEKDRIYLIGRGIDGPFVDKIFSTPKESPWTPSDEEMLKENFITNYANANDVAFSGVSISDVPKMEQELSQIPLYATLKQGDPAAYETVLKTVKDGVEKGKSLAEMRAVIMPVLQKAYMEKLPHADDASIVEFTNVVIDELKTLQKKDPVLCYNYANAQGDDQDYPHYFTDQLNEREGNAIAAVITSYSAERKVPSAQEFQADFETLGTSWAKLYGGDLTLLTGNVSAAADKAKACQITISLYQLAVSLPENKAADVLRYLYDQRNHTGQ